jgi:protein phosphatase
MQQVELTWGAATHIGQRRDNQDRCVATPPVFAVADGMGGHAAGGPAAEAAVGRLAQAGNGRTVGLAPLLAALRAADQDIRGITGPDGHPSGAGTTVAGLALIEDAGEVYWAAFHLGDSRVYRWSAAGFEQISTDHSLVQELVDRGSISEREALSHPQRHVITRALGIGPQVEADVALLPVAAGDRFLLCSDGLTGEVSDERIAAMMSGDAPASDVADRLVSAAVAHGGSDNVTVVVVHVHPANGSDPVD